MSKNFARMYEMNFLTKTLIVFGFAIVFFLIITKEILFSDPVRMFDNSINLFFFEHRTPLLSECFLWLTKLGNWNIVLCMVFLVSVYIAVTKRYKYFLPFVTTVAGSGLTVYLLKTLIGRDRPGVEISHYIEQSLSFPSGHAALSLALYGYVAYFLLEICGTQKNPRPQARVWAVYSVVSILVLLIGLSRLYLGVHFLTDVVGGYLIGLVWLIIGIALTEIVWKK